MLMMEAIGAIKRLEDEVRRYQVEAITPEESDRP